MQPSKLLALALLALTACTTSDDAGDPADQLGGKADGFSPPRRGWLALEKPETVNVAFADDDVVYAELAVSGPASATFDTGSPDTVLYLYAPLGDDWWVRIAKHRSDLAVDLDAGTYRLLLRRTDHATTSVDVSATCDGPGCQVYPAFPFTAPQIVNVKGGPVLVEPRLTSVTFDGDALREPLDDFLARVGDTDYWTQTTSEYGIGAATATPPLHVAEAAPASLTRDEMRAWLAGKLDGTHPEWGAPDAHSFYVVFFPATTALDLDGAKGCTGFGGYHDAVTLPSGLVVVYAAVPRCASFNGVPGLDAVTMSTSHELIEGVTDPQPSGMTAFALPDDDHAAWAIETGGEAGDMCAAVPAANTHVPGIPYLVQRTWSNAAARAGHDPCVPHVSADPFVVAIPVLDTVTLGDNKTLGVRVPAGESRTIEVDLASDAPTRAPWQLVAVDGGTLLGQEPGVELSWDRTTGDNGDRAYLTIRTTHANPRGFGTIIVGAKTAADNGTLWHAMITY